MTKRELADGIRIVVFRVERERSPVPYEQPIPFGGLSERTKEYWLAVADAAATLTGFQLQEATDD